MSDKRYSKVEQEIIQILDQIEKNEPAKSRPQLRLLPGGRRKRRFTIRKPRKPALPRSRPSWFWLALAFGLALAAVIVSDVSHTLAVLLAIASIGSFAAPIFSGRDRLPNSTVTGPKTWRGRDITFEPGMDDSPADRLRRWRERRRRGPRF